MAKQFQLIISLVLFAAVTITAAYFLFARAEYYDGRSGNKTPAVFTGGSVQSLQLRFEAWKTYPEYTIGFGVLTGVGFAGMLWNMYLLSGKGKSESCKR